MVHGGLGVGQGNVGTSSMWQMVSGICEHGHTYQGWFRWPSGFQTRWWSTGGQQHNAMGGYMLVVPWVLLWSAVVVGRSQTNIPRGPWLVAVSSLLNSVPLSGLWTIAVPCQVCLRKCTNSIKLPGLLLHPLTLGAEPIALWKGLWWCWGTALTFLQIVLANLQDILV